MPDSFQVEFPISTNFQTKLRQLVERFSDLHGSPIKLKAVLSASLKALQDIPAEKIDALRSEFEDSTVDKNIKIFRKTSNLDFQDRTLLEDIKLYLLTHQKSNFSLKEIMLAIILVAYNLNDEQISYILSEYH